MDEKICASFVLEILGRPADHVTDSLKGIIAKLETENGIDVNKKKLHEPKEVDMKGKEVPEDKKLFTSFAEIEAEFETIERLMATAFNYMPSNIEIISPAKVSFGNFHLSELLTSIILQLHKYDEVTKKLFMDREILMNKIKEKGIKIKDLDKKNNQT